LSVGVRDAAGNEDPVYGSRLAAVGAPPGFTQTGADDTNAPVIRSVAISPGPVDTSTSPATVTVTVRATDDLSGVFLDSASWSSMNMVTLISPSQQTASAVLQLASGDDHDGTLVGHVTLPLHSEQGTWTVRDVNIYDRAGNWAAQPPAPLPTVDVTRTGG
jgi:hypothetical protein